MKNWDVLKDLAENPKLTFKNLRFGGVLGYLPNGTLGWISNSNHDGEAFSIHHVIGGGINNGNWNDDWELVREPVGFIIAINSGKNIKYETWDDYYTIREALYILSKHPLTQNMINGKWYIS